MININYKYNIILIFTLLLIIFLERVYQKEIYFSKEYQINTKNNLNDDINVVIPILKHKIDLNFYSNNTLCKDYINSNVISKSIFYNDVVIDLDYLNQLEAKKTILIKLHSKTSLFSCDLILNINDLYADMLKKILLFILPLLTIMYLLFKMAWSIIQGFIIQSRE